MTVTIESLNKEIHRLHGRINVLTALVGSLIDTSEIPDFRDVAMEYLLDEYPGCKHEAPEIEDIYIDALQQTAKWLREFKHDTL